MIKVRKISAEELNKILEKHIVWLQDKNGEMGSRADLSVADLSGANLSGADLSRANLSEADLSGANLSEANLSVADLIVADLSEADLSGANLTGANLNGANLIRTDLSEADLIRTDFIGANLSGANLSGANLSGANLRGANLWGANLRRADLREAKLNGANLNGADLSVADLTEADLVNADIFSATFTKARLIRANLITAKCLEIGEWTDANIDGIIIDGYIKNKIPKELLEKYKDTISVVQDEEGFTTLFQFPDHLRTACEQYLSYFGDFLKDLGDLANTSLRREGINTFFSVIPEDKEVALERITEALSFFLGLTVVPENDISTNREQDQRQKIALNRYKQEYYGLKSKLASKEAENAALQLATGALSKNAEMSEEALSAVMLLCFKCIESKGSRIDAKTFLKNAIKLTQIKLPGATINVDYIVKNARLLTVDTKKK